MTTSTPTKIVWFKRIATASFLFFLIKGLIWLGIALSVVIWSL